MDAEESKTNQNYRINFTSIGIQHLAFFTIFRLWHFNVFYSANGSRKFNCTIDSTKKNKSFNAIDSFFNNGFIRILLRLNMPANPKYLTKSKWQRFAKITAAILGGYFVSVTFHLALATWFNRANVLITMAFSGFILWVALMVIAFLAKNGWKIWMIYILLSLIFSLLIYLGQTYNPTAQ